MKLLPLIPGYFLHGHDQFIQLETSRNSPNRKGVVLSIEPKEHRYYHALYVVKIHFANYTLEVEAFDIDQVDEKAAREVIEFHRE